MTERGALEIARAADVAGTARPERSIASAGVRPAVAARPVGVRPAVATRPTTRGLDQAVATIARVGVLVGASTAVYAVSLAGVSALQAAEDRAIAEARTPRVAALDAAAEANDRLEAAVLRAGQAAGDLGAAYGSTAAAVASYESRIATLAALVGEVQGQAAALPTRIALPSVSVRGTTAAPRTRTTTGASGG